MPSERDQIAVRDALDLRLFDGGRARFKWLPSPAGYVCGLVNSKNRMGAYVGYSPFIATLWGPRIESLLVAPEDDRAAVEFVRVCDNDGKSTK
jgi:hypothetical protein